MVSIFWTAVSVALWTGLILLGSWDRRRDFNRTERVASWITWAMFIASAMTVHLFACFWFGAF